MAEYLLRPSHGRFDRVKTGDRCSRGASVIRIGFVACGVCLGEDDRWPYILVKFESIWSSKQPLFDFNLRIEIVYNHVN